MAETQTHNFPDDDALLTAKAVADRYGVHIKNVRGLVKSGKIPSPVPGWKGKRRWLKSEIVTHIRSLQKADRKQAS